MTRTPNNLRRARAFIDEVNARTVCRDCGAQSIEWHNPEHVLLKRPHFRISSLVGSGASPKRIQAELDHCTPLCRRCHMREDGRLSFIAASIMPIQPPRPCAACARPSKPLSKGMCKRCYDQRRNQAKKTVTHAAWTCEQLVRAADVEDGHRLGWPADEREGGRVC